MKQYFVTALAAALSVCAAGAEEQASGLVFDASKGVAGSVTMPQGKVVNYTAYTHLYYVTNVEDSTYQYLNVYVPEGATQRTPIFMPNAVGGYMAAAPKEMDGADASGRVLAEGYVVAMPGARGRNSVVTGKDGKEVYTGRAPMGLLDLKAAVRYLRKFDAVMPGDAERIISDGTSAGGAMSSLLGTTGNHPVYEPYLREMGTADTRDDIFAAVCFCPIVDLDHADMAYEWLYGCTNNVTRPVNSEQEAVSKELAAQFAGYVDGLGLEKPDGTPLTSDNYRDYIKELIIAAAQEAKDAGADMPDSVGLVFSQQARFAAPVNGGKKMPNKGNRPPQVPTHGERNMPPRMGMPNRVGEYVIDLDLDKYLNYIVTTIPLKTPPAFDSQGVAGGKASGENEEFGDATGNSVNFTDYSLRKATGNTDVRVDENIRKLVWMMNPMNFISDKQSTVAAHWYIRHGARDRDTAFPIPINLATKLQNAGKEVDFKLPWNRPHSGDYALNELFAWMRTL